MIYKFKCRAAGDVLMLGPHGDQVLSIMGRQPAASGIFEPAAMPALMATLQRAAEEDSARRAQPVDDEQAPGSPSVSLKQRIWPLLEMMRMAHAAQEPIVWGV